MEHRKGKRSTWRGHSACCLETNPTDSQVLSRFYGVVLSVFHDFERLAACPFGIRFPLKGELWRVGLGWLATGLLCGLGF